MLPVHNVPRKGGRRDGGDARSVPVIQLCIVFLLLVYAAVLHVSLGVVSTACGDAAARASNGDAPSAAPALPSVPPGRDEDKLQRSPPPPQQQQQQQERQQQQQQQQQPVAPHAASGTSVSGSASTVRTGVVVLGMHRSGTSIVGGLMSKMGLNVGPNHLLIQPNFDNKKGFFERVDVVLQNDQLMGEQGVSYSLNTHRYDYQRAIKQALTRSGEKFFKEGTKALAFLNNPSSMPWMLKDPRLCITLRTWLPLLSSVPAVLFTYRHPLDVARSLHVRYERFQFPRSLKLWLSYNRSAVRGSKDLCRVVTSNSRVLSSPRGELDRIYDELRGCGLDVPHKVAQSDIDEFIDPSLQHGKMSLTDNSCGELRRGGVDTAVAIAARHKSTQQWTPSDDTQRKLLYDVLRVYCDLEDGTALRAGYEWPEYPDH